MTIELSTTESHQILMMVMDRIESVESFIDFDAMVDLPAPLSHEAELAVLSSIRGKLEKSAGAGDGDEIELLRISFVRQPEPATLAAFARPPR
jgi:hypothetical protein